MCFDINSNFISIPKQKGFDLWSIALFSPQSVEDEAIPKEAETLTVVVSWGE